MVVAEEEAVEVGVKVVAVAAEVEVLPTSINHCNKKMQQIAITIRNNSVQLVIITLIEYENYNQRLPLVYYV